MAFPGGMDDFVCFDGRCIVSGAPIGAAAADHPQGAAAVLNTVRRQLFLVDLLFQSIALPVLLRLARSPMVSDCSNHRAVLPHLPDSRVSDAPVLTLGHICRISELGDLSAELDGRPRQAPKKHHLPLFRQ